MDLWRKVLRVNYRSAGKELAEDLKVLSPSPWNYNVVLDADSQRCFQTQPPKKSQKKEEKKKPNPKLKLFF